MFEALVLGVVQGVTEFFPVSSTAHLVIAPKLFGFSSRLDSLAFNTALHGGTFLALLLAFWREWVAIARRERTLFLYLVIGTVPAAAAGMAFEQAIEQELRSPLSIALMLVVFGFVMLLAERFRGEREMAFLRLRDVIFIGFAQALALMPGVSRSGITIAAGLFIGLKRKEAARFAFLLSMPIVAGALVFEAKGFLEVGSMEPGVFVSAVLASMAAGFFAIKYLLKFLERHPLNVFVYYRFVFAAFIAGWWGLLWMRT